MLIFLRNLFIILSAYEIPKGFRGRINTAMYKTST